MTHALFGRAPELAELNALLTQRGAQNILVYGRRRVGKTTLVLEWARQTHLPTLYWVATRETPAQLRRSFSRVLWRWAYPESQAVPRFETWGDLFETTAQLIGERRVILILDEFSYAAEADPALPSYLQAAWDHFFKETRLILIVMGSHLGMMTRLMSYDAPLYGRFTALLPVDPLPFPALQDFLPRYETAERVAAYAVVGGIPGYLERFDDTTNVGANIQRLFVRRTGMFRSEPFVLIGDVIRRETQTYEAILQAIAGGAHTPQPIGEKLELTSSYLSPYLKQLEDLHLIERQLPATVPLNERQTSKKSRYVLADPYLRFYFRFIAPNLHLVEQEMPELLWERISEQFRAFVGSTTFEGLAREWVRVQAQRGKLGFLPEIIGSHWSAEVQVDVVALNWRERVILLGECKWGVEPLRRPVVHELFDKAPKVIPGKDWHVQLVYFARAGFTEAAAADATQAGAWLVDLQTLSRDLERVA